jgi:hypothetical protein
MALLSGISPDVSQSLTSKLVSSFNELRKQVDEGLISYPYSTRELVNSVRHLQVIERLTKMYPNDGVSRAINNVFAFDTHDKDLLKLLYETMNKNGIPIDDDASFFANIAEEFRLPELTILDKLTASGSLKVPTTTTALNVRVDSTYYRDRGRFVLCNLKRLPSRMVIIKFNRRKDQSVYRIDLFVRYLQWNGYCSRIKW